MKIVDKFNLRDYDIIVVGAGLTASIFARRFADSGKKVLIIEKRNHIAGNLYDYIDANGILVQKYGPHVFHTNEEDVNLFIHKYCKTKEFITKCSVYMHNQYTPSPFNFKTIDQFYSKDKAENLKRAIMEEFPNQKQTTIVKLLSSQNPLIREYAQFLYVSDYSLYTAKQWGVKANEIDLSVLERVPVLFNYDEQYFYDKYQYMPVGGFTRFIENLLNSKKIDIILNLNFFSNFALRNHSLLFNGEKITQKVIYTGPIDEIFKYKYGHLPYRSLSFKFKTYNRKSYQKTPITAYPEVEGYTRITEFNKMPIQNTEKTTVAFEYPLPTSKYNEPYYPILTQESILLFEKYREEACKVPGLVVAGRLGEFKYYNMDQAILRALNLLSTEI